MNAIFTLFQNPEFWTGTAFVLLVVLIARPLRKWARKWGRRQAQEVKTQIDEAKDLKTQAMSLLRDSERQIRTQSRERQRVLAVTDAEINMLKDQAARQIAAQSVYKKQELAVRMQMMSEQGWHTMVNNLMTRMMSQVQQKTKRRTQKRTVNVDHLFDALDV